MLKNLFIIVVSLVAILVGAAYYAYTQRDKIAEKVVEYTMQSLTGTSVAVNNEQNGEQNWVTALIDAGSKTMQTALDEAVSKQGNEAPAKNNNNRAPGLATMAEMFANGTNGQSGVDLNQMAQAFVNSLGIDSKEVITGNDINAHDTKGRTLLMNVCRTDIAPEALDMMLKYGADINAKDTNGRTALMYAVAFNQNPEVVAYLLKHGANAKITDSQGKTALDYAKKEEIIKLLKKAM